MGHVLEAALAAAAAVMLVAAPTPASGPGGEHRPPNAGAPAAAASHRAERPAAAAHAAPSALPIPDATAAALGGEPAAAPAHFVDAVQQAAVRSGPAGPSLTGLAILVVGGYLLVRHARRSVR